MTRRLHAWFHGEVLGHSQQRGHLIRTREPMPGLVHSFMQEYCACGCGKFWRFKR